MSSVERVLSAIGFVVVVAVTSGEALGAPTVWERIARPSAVIEERTRLEVEHLLFEAELFGLHSAIANDRFRLALSALDRIRAEQAKDIRLRFHLGRILGWLGEHERAVSVLEPLVAEAAAHPMVSEAMFRLAIAYAHLERRSDEVAIYDAYLGRVTAKGGRAVALSNRAEALMTIGELAAAIADFRASLAIIADPVATLGLAVALDRSGDFTAALTEADRAISLDPDNERLRGEGVFFLPAYERHWYEALSAMAHARNAKTPLEARLFWEAAVGYFRLYVEAAGDEDRWIAIARARMKACEREARKGR